MEKAFKIMCECVLCKTSFQAGIDIYEGHYIQKYKMNICSNCYKGNHDGISTFYEKIFEKHLSNNGINVPKRNDKGYYPL